MIHGDPFAVFGFVEMGVGAKVRAHGHGPRQNGSRITNPVAHLHKRRVGHRKIIRGLRRRAVVLLGARQGV